MNYKRPMGRMWHLYKMGGVAPAIASMFDAQNAQQMAFIRSVVKEQRNNEAYAIPLKQLETVVFDLETTGFSPYSGDEIISIGAVAMFGVQLKQNEAYYSLVNPKRDIPKVIVELTGITNDMAAAAPQLIESLRGFLEFADKRVLVAHGSGHDKHFLNTALWKTSRVKLSHRLIDCMIVAKWLSPAGKRYDLDSLLDAYGIPVTTRHHALKDSLMTAELWSKMIEDAEAHDVYTLGELYDRLSYL